MEDIRVTRDGRYYIVESGLTDMKFSVVSTDEIARTLQVDSESIAIIRAIMNQKVYNHRTTWNDIVEIFATILERVSAEWLISYLIEVPDYIVNDPAILLESAFREYGF